MTTQAMTRTLIALLLAATCQAATIIPLDGTKWKLYDFGAANLCGVNACTPADNHPGTYPNGGGIYFNFVNAPDLPVDTGGTVPTDWRNYLVTQPAVHKFTTAQTITATIQIVTGGDPNFGHFSESWNTGNAPTQIRIYFQSGTLFQSNADGSNRWWSNPTSIVPAQGTFTLTLQFDPANWSDANGKYGNFDANTSKEFAAALANVKWIGFTFGGGDSFGHGIDIQGDGATAQVIVQNLSIQ